MARKLDRRKAIELRKQSKSYFYIRSKLKVAKSTLSYWLKDIKLARNQLKKIQEDGELKRVERYLTTVRERRKKLFGKYLIKGRKDLLPITKRDFLIAGLFLYLGEGGKSTWWDVSISNTNPVIIKFTVFWLTKILKAPKNRIKVRLHLYKDMDIKKEFKFWQKTTGIPKNSFKKPYIKNTEYKKINYNSFGHGTCNIIINDTKLKNEIIAKMRVLLENSKSFLNDDFDTTTPNLVI